MNDPLALPSPDPAEPPPAPPPPDRRNLVPWVYGLGFVVLVLALLWIWQNPNSSPSAVRPQQVDAVEQQIQALDARVTQLAARPAPAVPALGTPRTAGCRPGKPPAGGAGPRPIGPADRGAEGAGCRDPGLRWACGRTWRRWKTGRAGWSRQVQDLSSLGAQLDDAAPAGRRPTDRSRQARRATRHRPAAICVTVRVAGQQRLGPAADGAATGERGGGGGRKAAGWFGCRPHAPRWPRDDR